MPELPEVETVRRVLEKWCINQTIKKVYVYYSPIVNNLSEDFLNKELVNQSIKSLDRIGKYLIFRLDDYSLVSHLRMEGKWHYGHFKDNTLINEGIAFDPSNLNDKNSKHVHFAIEFNDGHLLMYHDVRKFGRIELFNKDECYIKEPLTKLGYEPFNSLLNEDYLLNKFSKLKVSIKEALLDQSIMTGLGNIYCDEVLFMSNILPSTPAKEITFSQARKLIDNSIKVLNKAIELGGSTIKSYHAANSVDGKFQNLLLVYGKEGTNCVNCNSLIYKSKIGGRGTHFCPKCQKSNLKNRVIGITGLIGSGKSSVSKEFTKYGFKLLDADLIVKNAQEKDGYLYIKMIKLFKNYDILDSFLSLNRKRIREIILNDKSLDEALKNIVHKYVYSYIYEEIFKNPNNKYVLDIPLLFESHINEICDKVLLIRCSDEVLIERIENRNTMPLSDALKFKENQLSKLDYSKIDIIIDNDGSFLELENTVKNLVNTFNEER